MANNKKIKQKSSAPQEQKNDEISAVFAQILRHMPVVEYIKKLRKRRAVMPDAELLADVEARMRARRISARGPKPGETEARIDARSNHKKTRASDKETR